ncbi:hypothetical protein [uncultured Nevskia sp.]|uniref:hypothetical protein n=1 Tax=uncultured Nevskia sp. TaxID=228950 RepID=UPI0025D0D644|nr:hypothetical protein [uncultured Nevskia sp.]
MIDDEVARHVVSQEGLPALFPTHAHHVSFWEALGRAVATFGFLEETLAKAIFSFAATKPYAESEIEAAFSAWLPKLERLLSDQLGGLIDTYGKAIREHPRSTISNLNELLGDLRKASSTRNVLCHGSWRVPNTSGASLPLFMNRQNELCTTTFDVESLEGIRKHTVVLICAVINSVTHMGWQFPGSAGPGKVVWHHAHSAP